MLNYRILECKNQKKIATELYDFLNKKNGPLHRTNLKFWNFLDKKEVYECLISSPTLDEWLAELKLKVREISFTIFNEDIKTHPHIDEPPVIAKLNFPILNTSDTYNVWFNDDNKEIDRVECTNPIILRSNVLHTVEIGTTAKYPRIQVSFCFYNEPLEYLS